MVGQFFSGHITILVLLLAWNKVFCFRPLGEGKELKNRESDLDLEFSDTINGEVTNTDQNVLYINHGGGATSSIRRNLVVPPQFTPHVNSYPNSLFDSNYPGIPLVNYALEEDIPLSFERRNGEQDATFNALPQPQAQQQFYRPNAQQNRPFVPEYTTPSPSPHTPPPPSIGLPPASSPSPNQQHFNQVNAPYRQPQPQPQPYQPGPQQMPPDFFNFFESPFQNPPPPPPPPAQPQSSPTPLFQRRRLTVNNNVPDISHNSIGGGYPAYNYYKGDEEDAAAKWPKIFKFTDGRINLSEFEKDKKLGKVKFAKEEPLFDNVRRDSFLILHGGTYS